MVQAISLRSATSTQVDLRARVNLDIARKSTMTSIVLRAVSVISLMVDMTSRHVISTTDETLYVTLNYIISLAVHFDLLEHRCGLR